MVAHRHIPVTVIIPNFNSGDLLRRCVQSVYDGQVPAEVLVVDDGSTDESAQLAEQLCSEFPTLRLIRKASNSGIAATRNVGFVEAQTEWISYVDADDYIEAGALARAFEQLQQCGADICIWQMYLVSPAGCSLNINLGGLRFPLTGYEAAGLTLGGWKIHPLGVSRRSIYIEAMSGFQLNCHCADELVTRLAFSLAKRVICCESRYFYWTNPESTSRAISPKRLSVIDAQIWLVAFAKRYSAEVQQRTILGAIDQAYLLRSQSKYLGVDSVYAQLLVFLRYLLREGCIGPWLLLHPRRALKLLLCLVPAVGGLWVR